ncbi:hypothetical protein EVAR_22693_1 [Eumeta japonica]|uniref:Uncharacterized protein n=1 Tax=Eumeta variegata TaxID=151549 RepID=A0A4C1UTK3_EUMVA|nr:hypothetical protein EVAR_22693_1 [Eumeta japonica]
MANQQIEAIMKQVQLEQPHNTECARFKCQDWPAAVHGATNNSYTEITNGRSVAAHALRRPPRPEAMETVQINKSVELLLRNFTALYTADLSSDGQIFMPPKFMSSLR